MHLFGCKQLCGIFIVLTYPIYFLGSLFLVFSVLVFITSFTIYPSSIGAYDEDTIGSVFHSYQITFNQPWRLLAYNILLLPIVILSMKFFSWFCEISFNFINLLFEQIIGPSYSNIISYALSVLNLDFILRNSSLSEITIISDYVNFYNLGSELIRFLTSLFAEIFNIIIFLTFTTDC